MGHDLKAEEAGALQRIDDDLDAIFRRHGRNVRICHASGVGMERRLLFVPLLCDQPVLAFPADEFVARSPDWVLGAIERLLTQRAA